MVDSFDQLTSVTRTSPATNQKTAEYAAPIDLQWTNHGSATFGGLLSALVTRSLLDFHGQGWRPASLTLNYLDAPKPGTTARIVIEMDRKGRTFSYSNFRVFAEKGTKQITGTAVFTTLPATDPYMGRVDLTLPPATGVPDAYKAYEHIKGPGRYIEMFDVRDTGMTDERLDGVSLVGDASKPVFLRGSEKFLKLATSAPVSWPLLAMYGDLPLYPPSSFQDRMKRYEQGFRPIYSTISHTITFVHMPEKAVWLRQVRSDVLTCGEMKESEFLYVFLRSSPLRIITEI